MKGILTGLFLLLGLYSFAEHQEELTVYYKELRMHVTDKNGDPVKNLSEADFKILIDGALQDIGYFEEISSEPTAKKTSQNVEATEAAALPNFITLFLDSSQMRKRQFETAVQSMSKMIDRRTGGQNFVQVVHLDGLNVRACRFTNKAADLKKHLSSLVHQGNMLYANSEKQRLANSSEDFMQFSLRNSSEAAEAFAAGLPNDTIRQYMASGQTQFAFLGIYSRLMSTVAKGMTGRPGEKSVFLITSGQFGYTNLSQRISDNLNRKGITVYTMYMESSLGTPFQNNENRRNEDRIRLAKMAKESAEMTGGIFARASTSKKQEQAFDRLDRASSHYYRMAFPMTRGLEDKLKVTLAAKNDWTLTFSDYFRPDNSKLESVRKLETDLYRQKQEAQIRQELKRAQEANPMKSKKN